MMSKPTRSDLVVLRCRSVPQHVLHLQELVRPVSADDGEAETLRALPQGCAQHRPV